MRLIVEKIEGTVYVYLEGEVEYAKNQEDRETEGSRRLTARLLSEECDTSVYADNVHWVFALDPSHFESISSGCDLDCEIDDD